MSAARIPIALVEDHAGLREELAFHLSHAGYEVTALRCGAALDAHLARQPCRLVVLDLGLPGEDGLSICARLRQSHAGLGVVMLTARGMSQDRVAGWRQGADAYLVKPAPPAELEAVLASLLRRLPGQPGQSGAATAAPIFVLPAQPAALATSHEAAPSLWTLRLRSRVLAGPHSARIDLTHAECALLQVLVSNAPKPATRRDLVQALGGQYLTFEEHRLEVAMSRLRGKLRRAWPDGDTVRAARGVGYLLTRPCNTADS